MQIKKVCCFPSYKPWANRDIQFFSTEGILSWQKTNRRGRQSKGRCRRSWGRSKTATGRSYRKKLEVKLQRNTTKEVWDLILSGIHCLVCTKYYLDTHICWCTLHNIVPCSIILVFFLFHFQMLISALYVSHTTVDAYLYFQETVF